MKFALPATLALLVVATAVSAQTPEPRSGATLPAQFYGGVPSGDVTTEPLSLTIVEAISRALEHNLGRLTADANVDRANASRLEALAKLLPDLEAGVSETRQVVNLAAFGFPLPAGIPPIVGPFNVFDARVRVSQSVFDLSAIRGNRAEEHRVAAARYMVRSARDLVVLVSANAYLQVLAATGRVESARAQRDSADALFRQATNMKEAGLVAGIDVLRAEVQLGTERQRATAAQNELEKNKLQLARVIGLPIGQTFTLSDELPNVPTPDISLDQALDQAYQTRPDYQAALERVRAAETRRDAINGEYLPSIGIDANYGVLGLTPSDAARTYALMGSVRVPIFNGGRTRARLVGADADLRMARAEAEDMRATVYYDVKSAFLDLSATREQLDVATRARELAGQQLVQARDRFAAGVTDTVEIVQAQEAVARANEQYISALYGFNVSKALLARGLGIAEQAAREYLGGIR